MSQSTEIQNFSDDQLEVELLRRELARREINRRIWEGELEVTDGDSVVTMRDLQ